MRAVMTGTCTASVPRFMHLVQVLFWLKCEQCLTSSFADFCHKIAIIG